MVYLKQFSDFLQERYLQLDKNKLYVLSENEIDTNYIKDNFDIIGFFDNTVTRNNRVWFLDDKMLSGYSAHHDMDYLYEIVIKNNREIEISDVDGQKYLYEYIIHNKNKFNQDFISNLEEYKKDNIIGDKLYYSYKEYNHHHGEEIFNEVLKNIFQKENIGIISCRVQFSKQYISKKYILPSNIEYIKLISKKDDYSSEPEYDNKIEHIHGIEILKKYMAKAGETIPEKYYGYFSDIKPSKPIKIYRGMSWKYENLYKLKHFSKYPFYLDEELNVNYNRATSWTTNLIVAEEFAQLNSLWIILEMIINPDDIIIDTRKLSTNLRKELYDAYQREVIIKPKTYKCKIIKIGKDKDDNLKVGFEGYDYKVFADIEKSFELFADKYIKNNIFSGFGIKCSYQTKNKKIFDDYSVEVPLISIKKSNDKGVVEIRYEKDFYLQFNRWGTKSSFDDIHFNTSEDLIKYLNEYTELEKRINSFFSLNH